VAFGIKKPFLKARAKASAFPSTVGIPLFTDSGPESEALPDNAVADWPHGESPSGDRPTIGHVGRYSIKSQLGVGGLGMVYAAWDPILSRQVAIKTLHIDGEHDRSALEEMFIAEARAVAGLSHPHIVTVYDAGLSERGVYFAMEQLNGRDLRQLLAERWLPTVHDAARIMRRVAHALAYAHASGVIHCDIKPANIFMVGRRAPKVLDFGIARVAYRRHDHLAGLIAGSPHYMAPEQLRGEPIDRRCDVYSLGVVLYELLAGRKAFDGDSYAAIVSAVMESTPLPPHQIRNEVPPELSTIADRAMARNPADRFQTAAEMAHELRRWLDQAAVPVATDVTGKEDSIRGVKVSALHGVIVATLAAAAVAIGVFLLLPGVFDLPINHAAIGQIDHAATPAAAPTAASDSPLLLVATPLSAAPTATAAGSVISPGAAAPSEVAPIAPATK
jgi:serine/threonine-protein kinase